VLTVTFGAASAFTAREFLKIRQAIYPKLAPVAVDILEAPASQAYVERLFSLRIVVFKTQKSHDQITDCEGLFKDEYEHFAFTWCSVTDSEKEVNAKCLS